MGLELLKWTFSIRSVLGNLLAVRLPPGAGRGEESVPVCEERAPATCPGVELAGRRTGATRGMRGTGLRARDRSRRCGHRADAGPRIRDTDTIQDTDTMRWHAVVMP